MVDLIMNKFVIETLDDVLANDIKKLLEKEFQVPFRVFPIERGRPGPQTVPLAKRVRRMLAGGSLSKGELRRRMGNVLNADLVPVLAAMIERGEVVVEQCRPAVGRPTTRYTLVPDLDAAATIDGS